MQKSLQLLFDKLNETGVGRCSVAMLDMCTKIEYLKDETIPYLEVNQPTQLPEGGFTSNPAIHHQSYSTHRLSIRRLIYKGQEIKVTISKELQEFIDFNVASKIERLEELNKTLNTANQKLMTASWWSITKERFKKTIKGFLK